MNSKYFRTLFYFRTGGVSSKVLRIFYHCSETFIIDIRSKIGPGIKLANPYATINAESVGENCYIKHLVTMGEKNGRRHVIENKVKFHANCMVKDVPTNAVSIGHLATLILN